MIEAQVRDYAERPSVRREELYAEVYGSTKLLRGDARAPNTPLQRLTYPASRPPPGCYRVAMDPLYRRAIIQGILGTILFIALIFWPAGTFHYWQGWLFLAVFSASTIGFTIYLALYDKPLLERRLAAGPQHEKERSQKIIVSLILIGFFAAIVLSALDHRYGWSPVPPSVSIAGDVLICLHLLGH